MIFWVALRKEILEQWRSYRVLIVGVVLIVWSLASPLLAKYAPQMLKLALPQGEAILSLFPPPTAADAVDQYLKNVSQFGVLLALLVGMGTVAQEKDKGTAALMLVKPLPKAVFLAAKFLALGLTFAGSLAVAGAACLYYTRLLFGGLEVGPWLGANGLLLLLILVYVALTLLCSTLTSSQVAAAGMAFGAMIVLTTVGAIPKIGEPLPGKLATWGGELAKGASGTWWPALWVSLGLIVLALVGAWVALERQEL